MAQVIASVSSINGVFYVKHPDGSLVELSDGDKIYEGDIVLGNDSNNAMNNIVIALDDGSEMIMIGGEEQLFDASLVQESFAVEETVTDTSTLTALSEMEDTQDQQIIDNDTDDNVDNIETAAGESAHSSDASLHANFQQIDLKDVSIETKLNDMEAKEEDSGGVYENINNNRSILGDNTQTEFFSTLIVEKSKVDELIRVVNVSAQAAIDAATTAKEIAETAQNNPTVENLEAAENAENQSTDAAKNLESVLSDLQSAVKELNAAATATGENVDTSAAGQAISDGNYALQIAVAAGEINDRISNISDSDISDNIIDENVADGTYTGITLAVIDVDGESVTYSVEDGVPFRVEEDGKVVVDGSNAIDFETTRTYTFNVTAISADGTSSTQSVTVDVQAAKDTAVQNEIDSDKAVNDLHAAADTAADTANSAIAAADKAVDTLAANNNPTAADIQSAQDAIDAADKAIATANDAKDAYIKAATDAGETIQDTTAVGSTDAIQAAKDTAVQNEIDSDKGDDTIILDTNDTINGGTGFDTLLVTDNDMNIDLSAIENKVSNIESINLNDGNNELTNIHLEDVINVTDEENVLRIDGDSSNHIELDTQGDDAEWKLGDFKTDSETGNSYQEYTATDDDGSIVTIEVDSNIHVDES